MSIQYNKQFDLSLKTAVVTGAGGILGTEFCHGLASHGADIALIDVNFEAIVALQDILTEKYGIVAKSYCCDIAQQDAVIQTVQSIVADFGSIDILHNNAAGKTNDLKALFAPFEEYSPDVWREIMSINIDGMFLMAQSVGKHMVEQGNGGSIIQTSSIYGVAAPDQRIYEGSEYMGVEINTPAVYSASKAAVIGLSQYLSTYWAKHNIRVNTLTPGGVSSGQNSTFQDNYSARVPMGRMAFSHEMVGTLVFLASDAASYITGQNIIIDGGLTTW